MNLFKRKQVSAAGFPVLNTERLVLRAFDENDAVDVFAYAQSEKVGPMAGWAPHKTLEESRKTVQAFIAAGDCWAVVDKRIGHVIGAISLHVDGKRRLEGCRQMGYALGEEYWGKGYATEACREVLRYAFEDLGAPLVSAQHFPMNQKSRRVLKKLGFTYEGTLRRTNLLYDGSYADSLVYSLLKEEYEAQNAASK